MMVFVPNVQATVTMITIVLVNLGVHKEVEPSRKSLGVVGVEMTVIVTWTFVSVQ